MHGRLAAKLLTARANTQQLLQAAAKEVTNSKQQCSQRLAIRLSGP